jgi:hypothetical protein
MTKLVVPAYFHPYLRPDDWAALVHHADQLRAVVLNIASGPGTWPDEAFVPWVLQLRRAGVCVAGYVDTDYGHRPKGEVLAELSRYIDWYGVAGVFLDRVSATAGDVDHYAALAECARAMGLHTVAFNHGAQPVAEYAAHADLLGTFEGPWWVYLDASVPRWVRQWPEDRFFHLVYSVPRTLFGEAGRLAERRHAANAYITDQGGSNPWRTLPAGLSASAVS